ncbi:MAG: general secretion pathway protein GspH [Geobacter sp.]|nr:general secretion pathway protein GspH [Geobacter sp.]
MIELAVVIAILGMVALLVYPRLPSTDDARLRGSARSLAATIRYLGDRSVATKSGYRMRFDISGNDVSIVRGDTGAPEAGDTFTDRRLLADGVAIEDVTTPSQGKKNAGEAVLGFGAFGIGEFAAIHLKSEKGGRFTVFAYPANGKVKALEGYLESET